jgi:hypothetical protein
MLLVAANFALALDHHRSKVFNATRSLRSRFRICRLTQSSLLLGAFTPEALHFQVESTIYIFKVLIPVWIVWEKNYGLTRSTSGIGVSGAAVEISRLKRSVVPSNIHPPSLQRELFSIDFPSRKRSAFAVASRSAR